MGENRISMQKTNETRVTPWHAFGRYGATHYRIWNKLTPHGMFQRHEWMMEDGSSNVEGWIPGTGTWAVGCVPTKAETGGTP